MTQDEFDAWNKFLARAEQQQREFQEWRERVDREEAEFQQRMAMARLRGEFNHHGIACLMATALNPNISAAQFDRIAAVVLRPLGNTT